MKKCKSAYCVSVRISNLTWISSLKCCNYRQGYTLLTSKYVQKYDIILILTVYIPWGFGAVLV